MSQWVRFERRGSLGLAALARPERINALNLEMLLALEAQLLGWATDDSVACVFLSGDGDRGFCAGGDVRAICEALAADGPGYGEASFAAEYRIVHQLHTYPKPVVAWGHGAIMGAGLGLFVAAHTRLLTPDAKLAMPEVTIGLFPDVGAAHFISRLPDGVGLFAALTALRLSAEDALDFGLADALVPPGAQEEIIGALADADASQVVERCQRNRIQAEEGELHARRHQIRALVSEPALYAKLSDLASSDDPWWAAAGAGFENASPTSLRIAEEALRRGKQMSLAECLQQDLTLAAQCMRHRDFAEGVRARLIDRDGNPLWEASDPEKVNPGEVLAHFEPPWDLHPLGDLI